MRKKLNERNGDYYFDNKKEGRNNASSSSLRCRALLVCIYRNVRLLDSLCREGWGRGRRETWRPKIDDQ